MKGVLKMKKALSLILALIFVLSILVSCSSESEAPRTFPNAYNSPPENDNGGTPTDDEDYTFGMNIEEFIERLNRRFLDDDGYIFQSSQLNLSDFQVETKHEALLNCTVKAYTAQRILISSSTGLPIQTNSFINIAVDPESGEVLAVSSAVRKADGVNATESQQTFLLAVDWHMILVVLGVSNSVNNTSEMMMRAIESNTETKEGRYLLLVTASQTHLFNTAFVPPRTQSTSPPPSPSEPPTEPSPSPDDVDPTDLGDPYDSDPTPDTGGMDDILAEYDLLFLKNYSESINAQLFKQAPIRVSISELFTDNVWNLISFSELEELFGNTVLFEEDEEVGLPYVYCETPFFEFRFYVENIFAETCDSVMIIRK
jgi:hypothetical protein